jgi:hypothetical protein
LLVDGAVELGGAELVVSSSPGEEVVGLPAVVLERDVVPEADVPVGAGTADVVVAAVLAGGCTTDSTGARLRVVEAGASSRGATA